MTRTKRSLKNHTNTWTLILLLLGVYLVWPLIGGQDVNLPPQQMETGNENR